MDVCAHQEPDSSDSAAYAVYVYTCKQVSRRTKDIDEIDRVGLQAKHEEVAAQADLLRHILGNPFRAIGAVTVLHPSITHPTESLYAGEDCSFALRDALLEAGHVELADHFKDKDHPKGCWALDLLLGKS